MNRPRFQFPRFSSNDILRLGILGMAWLVVLGLTIIRFGPGGSGEMIERVDQATMQLAPSQQEVDLGGGDGLALSSSTWDEIVDLPDPETIEVEETSGFDLALSADLPLDSPGEEIVESPAAASLPLNDAINSLTERIAVGMRHGNEMVAEDTQDELQTVVERMNRAGVPVVISVYDSPIDAARRLAVKVQALFVASGLDSSLLEVIARDGTAEAQVELLAAHSFLDL